MKKIIIILLISFVSVAVHAQLANTKWKGSLQIEGGLDVLFNFRNDTLEVTNAKSDETIETMKYAIKDSVMTFHKLYGQSQCDTATIGTYKFEIKNNQMSLSLISDSCYQRSNAIGNMKLDKE